MQAVLSLGDQHLYITIDYHELINFSITSITN